MSAGNGDTRDRILDAVMNLIRGGGVHAVTLSAVCRAARLSKGGLVHHFPTKDAMIDAFLDRAAGRYLHYLDANLGQIPLGAGRWAVAFLDLLLNETVAEEPKCRVQDADHLAGSGDLAGSDDQCAAVMLALIQSAGRDGIAKSLFENVLRTLCADGLSLDLATTVLMALDGFWFQSVIENPVEVRRRAERLRVQLQKQIRAESLG